MNINLKDLQNQSQWRKEEGNRKKKKKGGGGARSMEMVSSREIKKKKKESTGKISTENGKQKTDQMSSPNMEHPVKRKIYVYPQSYMFIQTSSLKQTQKRWGKTKKNIKSCTAK
jgi:hypothetical protein